MLRVFLEDSILTVRTAALTQGHSLTKHVSIRESLSVVELTKGSGDEGNLNSTTFSVWPRMGRWLLFTHDQCR
jgi:hypothetical protein